MTQFEQDKQFIVNSVKNFTDPSVSVFTNVARVIVAMDFAVKRNELYGDGMGRFNRAVKALIEESVIKRSTKGNDTYYSVA
jgi:hypothetical protein